MQREYVERRDGAYYVTGSRVSLESSAKPASPEIQSRLDETRKRLLSKQA